MTGRARDLLTPADGQKPRELAVGGFRIMASARREIMSIETSPGDPRAKELIGVRAGGASRRALAETLGDIEGSPLFQLLDDFAGASLVAGWIWSRWIEDWFSRTNRSAASSTAGRNGVMDNICTGFAAGASSFLPDGSPDNINQSNAEVGPLENPDDAVGWHIMPHQSGPQKRRARRIDLWREGGLIKVDAGFQDAGSTPNGGRTAVHEYQVYAEIDEASMTLSALQALPLILPYRECPGASVKASRLVGQPVAGLRQSVLDELAGTNGCTHLNDVLRGLADVPLLSKLLP